MVTTSSRARRSTLRLAMLGATPNLRPLAHQHQQLVGHHLSRLLPDQGLEVAAEERVQARPLLASQRPRPLQEVAINRNREVLPHTRMMYPRILGQSQRDLAVTGISR
jgi:hypothetical protein